MLKNQRVRLVLWRTHVNEGSVVVVRGLVVDESETMLKVDGRLYQQMMDENSDETIERPIGSENRTFVVPVSTVRYGEVITEDSPAEKIDRKARLQKPLSRGEIRKIGGLT